MSSCGDKLSGGGKRVREEEDQQAKRLRTSQEGDRMMEEEVWMVKLSVSRDIQDSLIRSTLAGLTSHPGRIQTAIDILSNEDNPRLSFLKQREMEAILECFPDIDTTYVKSKIAAAKNYGKQNIDLDSFILNLLLTGYKRNASYTKEQITRDQAITRETGSDDQEDHEIMRSATRSGEHRLPHETFHSNNPLIIDPDDRHADTSTTSSLDTAPESCERLVCMCCFDEFLQMELVVCDEGHVFCVTCIRISIQTELARGQAHHHCLNYQCQAEYHNSTWRRVLDPPTLEHCLRRQQEEDIRSVNIENLVRCPRCSYAVVVDDPACTEIFCLNSSCLHRSCRLCLEESHEPLRCDQVEQGTEKQMRAFIEREMSEAMIRECYGCGKRYIKLTGCNHITCSCGAHMCYVCRAPITGYDHFSSSSCPANSDMGALHAKEMMEALEQARQSYIAAHPGTEQLVLRYDPVAHLIQPITDHYSDDNEEEQYEPDDFEPDEYYDNEFDDEWL